jgi:hypothetical protein
LGIGDWAQSPIPNPQSPIPNPHDKLIIIITIIIFHSRKIIKFINEAKKVRQENNDNIYK